MPDLTPVSPERHGARRWRRFSSYAFVQAHPVVPVVLGEHEQVAACLPILFAPQPEKKSDVPPWPVALTRLGAKTALVAGNGVWRGSYVPSILRVHPFHARPTEDGRFALLVDEDSGLVTEDNGDPQDVAFFTADEELTPALAQVVDFFRNRVEAETRTRTAMDAIARAGVLEPFIPPEGLSLPVAGLWGVNATALAGLGRVALADLHRTGALALAHAALVARHHLGFLAHAEAQLSRAAAPAPSPVAPSAEDSALSGFFDALASAQAQDKAQGLADLFGPGTRPPGDPSGDGRS